jgi:hypothetical protein
MIFGMALGLAIGILFSLYAVALFLIRGPAPFIANGTTFASAVGGYLG